MSRGYRDNMSTYSSDSEDDGSVCSGSLGGEIRRYEDMPQVDGVLAPGLGCFTFINPLTLRDITVYYIKSKKYNKKNPPVMIFHGVFRNPDIYRDAWIDLAEEHGFFIIAPLFSEDQFPGSAGYNLGNIFVSEEDRTPQPQRNWSYNIPGVVFDFFSSEQGKGDTTAPGYVAYGHSAGSQFLHRKVAITPDHRLLLAVASNAGWYTMPTTIDLWPYGWGGFEEAGISLPADFLVDFLATPLIVQLGLNDTDKKHRNLRRTPEALAQGVNRLERGNSFFKKGQQLAQEKGLSFNWKLEYVEGVGHNSAKMAPLAAQYISDYIASNTIRGRWQYPSPPEPELVPISSPIIARFEEGIGQSTPTVSYGLDANPPLDFAICIHGGAGVISKSDAVAEQFTQALRDKIRRCHYFALDDPTRTAVDIAEFAVNMLENDPLFNAGIGAVFTTDETHELEASIMDGCKLACGASALLTNVKNPVSLARKVMEGGKHVWIAGNPGECLAEMADLELVDSNADFSVPRRLAQLERAKELQGVFNDHDAGVASVEEGRQSSQESILHEVNPVVGTGRLGPDGLNLDDEINTETVGCVVMRNGHVCAATSTGGMTNKSSGRIGDTPMIGCGTYANDKTCAVSATGKGEEFIRHIVAYDISARMEYAGLSLMDACKATVHTRLPAESGGVIAVDGQGNTAMVFNSRGMFRASCNSKGEFTLGIWEDEEKWIECFQELVG